MKKSNFIINNFEDLFNLKEAICEYDRIEVDCKNLLTRGLLRHALVYSSFKLNDQGQIVLYDQGGSLMSSDINNLQRGVLMAELVQTGFHKYIISKYNNNNEILLSGFDYSRKKLNSISFGIVASGDLSEKDALIRAIESAIQACNFGSKYMSGKVVVCGPSNEIKRFLPTNLLENINILDFSISKKQNRIEIGKKKNFLLNSLNSDVVMITHARIRFPRNIIKILASSPFQIAAPKVIDEYCDSYLDICFTKDRTLTKTRHNSNISGRYFDEKSYLLGYRKWYPWLDGAVNIINKKDINDSKKFWHSDLGFGECEDIVMSRIACEYGLLVDYLPKIICHSSVSKMSPRGWLKKRLQRIIWEYIIT